MHQNSFSAGAPPADPARGANPNRLGRGTSPPHILPPRRLRRLDLGALVISLPTQVSGYVTPMVPCRGTLQKIFRPSLGATVIASEHHITIIRPVCANCQVNRANGRDNVLFNVSLSVCVHRTSQLAQWTTLLKNVDFGGF